MTMVTARSLHPITMDIRPVDPTMPHTEGKIYYWCFGRRIPAGFWSFDKWSKQPNYWTGWLLHNKGTDYLRVLHMAAKDLNPEVDNLLAAAIVRAQEYQHALESTPTDNNVVVQFSSD